jgi:hypothetical protein
MKPEELWHWYQAMTVPASVPPSYGNALWVGAGYGQWVFPTALQSTLCDDVTSENRQWNMSNTVKPVAIPDALPSLGSAGHLTGSCKPCAFAYEGCANAEQCTFCHLCPPGELKRRKREKLANRRRQARSDRTGTD